MSADLMLRETLALEVLEAEARVRDLETDNKALRETLHACLDQLHRSQVQLARYQSALAELTTAARQRHPRTEAA